MAMKVRYTVLDGEIVEENRNGVITDYVADPLGSTVALLDGSHTKSDTFNYWPYGEVQSRSGSTATPFQFVGTLGYYRDSSLRTYVRARCYRQSLGRWQTPDISAVIPSDPWYAIQNPITFGDPTGYSPVGPSSLCQEYGSDKFVSAWKAVKPNLDKLIHNAIWSEPCCVDLMFKGVRLGLTNMNFSTLTEGGAWINRLIWCIMCLETRWNKGDCTGRHHDVTTSAWGLFGFVSDTWHRFAGDTASDHTIANQIRVGVKLVCMELCKRHGGCKNCGMKWGRKPYPEFGPGSPYLSPTYPSNQWPYMPGGVDPDHYQWFLDCMYGKGSHKAGDNPPTPWG